MAVQPVFYGLGNGSGKHLSDIIERCKFLLRVRTTVLFYHRPAPFEAQCHERKHSQTAREVAQQTTWIDYNSWIRKKMWIKLLKCGSAYHRKCLEAVLVEWITHPIHSMLLIVGLITNVPIQTAWRKGRSVGWIYEEDCKRKNCGTLDHQDTAVSVAVPRRGKGTEKYEKKLTVARKQP